jgi:hypothetical protein
MTRSRLPIAALVFLTALAAPCLPAYAQIAATPAPGVWGWSGRNGVAFDPVNDVYLVIVAAGDVPLTGRFINKSGNQVGLDFAISTEPAFVGWMSVAFGGPPSDPAFLVTYTVADNVLNPKYARLVRYLPGLPPSVTGAVKIVDVVSEWYSSEKAQNYWNGQQFIVGTRVLPPGYSLPAPQVNRVDMALNVSAPQLLGDGVDYYGAPALSCSEAAACIAIGFRAGVPTGNSGGTYGQLFDGTTLAPLSGLIVLSAVGPNEDQGVVYLKHTGMFLAQWFRGGGAGYIDTRLIVPDGTLGPLDLSKGIGPGAGTNAIAYNQKTQTSLLLTKNAIDALTALELGDDGYPIRPANVVTLTLHDGVHDYLPALAANQEDGQWLVTAILKTGAFGRLVQGTPVDPTQIPVSILTDSVLPVATETLPYSRLLLASGGVYPYTWTQVSGTLPPGINLVNNRLEGTSTTPGSYAFRLRVTSTDLQVAERDFTLVVQAVIIMPPGGAGAHIAAGGPTLFMSPGRALRNHLAYDPAHQVYLMIVGAGDSPVIGRFLNKDGLAVAPDFQITTESGYAGWVSIAFGGPPTDPNFLVTYIVGDNVVNSKYARFVRFVPGGWPSVTGAIKIVDVFSEWYAAEKATQVWTGQHWVIGTRVIPPGFTLPSPQVNLLDMSGNLSAPVYLGDGLDYYGSPAVSCAANSVCLGIGFMGGISTGGLGGTYARRFNGATLSPLGGLFYLAVGNRNEEQAVVYQAHTGLFLAEWFRGSGPGILDTRLIATDGSMSVLDLNRGIGPSAGTSAIAYNPSTQTTLLVTKWTANSLVVMELGDDGYPLDLSNLVLITNHDGTVPDYWPSVAANPTDRQWLVTANLSAGLIGRVIQGSVPGASYPVQNWEFSGGMVGWSQFALPGPGDLVTAVTNGVLQFYRNPLLPGQSGQGVIFQALGTPLGAGAPVSADFDIGNSSTVWKRMTILLHDLDFSDLQVCSFWLAPGAPLRTYRMLTHTTVAWDNLTISFYASNTGSDGGGYLLDNVRVYAMAGQAVDRTVCVDPTTPNPYPFPDSGSFIANGDFSQGLTAWGVFGQLTYQLTGGVFEFVRPAGTPAGVVLQPTGTALPDQARLTATFQLGNSSPVRRRITVLIHDNDFSDFATCSFWLAPSTPLSTHRMMFVVKKPWANATFAVYPANVDTTPWLQLDNVSLIVSWSAPMLGTECIEPPGIPAPPGFGAQRIQESQSFAPARPTTARSEPLWTASTGEGGTQAFLLSAPIDLTDASTPTLNFESRLSGEHSAALVEVTRDGVNWIRVAQVPPSEDWTTITVDLADFSGNVIYLRFVYAGAEPVGGAPVEAWAIRAVRVDLRGPRTIQRLR